MWPLHDKGSSSFSSLTSLTDRHLEADTWNLWLYHKKGEIIAFCFSATSTDANHHQIICLISVCFKMPFNRYTKALFAVCVPKFLFILQTVHDMNANWLSLDFDIIPLNMTKSGILRNLHTILVINYRFLLNTKRLSWSKINSTTLLAEILIRSIYENYK